MNIYSASIYVCMFISLFLCATHAHCVQSTWWIVSLPRTDPLRMGSEPGSRFNRPTSRKHNSNSSKHIYIYSICIYHIIYIHVLKIFVHLFTLFVKIRSTVVEEIGVTRVYSVIKCLQLNEFMISNSFTVCHDLLWLFTSQFISPIMKKINM